MQAERKLPQIETARACKAVVERVMADAQIERDDLNYLAKVFVSYLGIMLNQLATLTLRSMDTSRYHLMRSLYFFSAS